MKRFVKSILKKVIAGFNFSIKKRINGKYYKIPILGGLGMSNFLLEELWMIDLLGIIVKSNKGKFVDVGANIGQTLLKLKSVNKEIEYLGFEPNPNCIYYTNKLIHINSFKKTTILPVGIYKETKLELLNHYSDSMVDPSASIISDFRENTVFRSEFVPLFSINDLKEDINFNDMLVLKVDVEGAEMEIIESLFEVIKSNNPFILMEVLPVYNENKNPDRLKRQCKIEDILKNLNYTIFRILKNKKEFLGLEKLDSFGVHSDLNQCEYLFIPKVKLLEMKHYIKY